MAAVPAPDGKPARPAWRAAGIFAAYLCLGFALAALIVTAASR